MRKRHAVLALLALLSVITYLDRICIGVAGPRMQDDLGLSPEKWGWVLSVFIISYGVFEIPSGAMGDRLGHRGVLMRIVVWWSVFTSLTGVAWNYAVLLMTRFLSGWERRARIRIWRASWPAGFPRTSAQERRG